VHPISAPGGAGPISFEVIARTWLHRVRFCTDEAEIFDELRYLECDPEIAGAFTNELCISIEPQGSYYQIAQDGRVIHERIGPQAVADMLHARLALLSLADFPAAPLIHAASLRRGGRRVLLVGPKGGGKTTLTLRLIQEGYEIEGDENVFITPEGVVARPRALRVKQTTASLFAPLAEAFKEAPYYESGQGIRIYNLDPRKAGAAFWRIELGPVNAVVLLRPNHSGCSSMRPIAPLPLVREVIRESAFPETGRARAVGDITKLIGAARGFDLCLGDLDGAVSCLDSVFS
jgi:hypothetical protein